MFAYVKFVEGPHLGKKYVVSVEKIQHTFDNLNFQKNKKYKAEHKDGNNYKCQILLMAETESQLQIEIDLKRVKSVPPSQLVSATETEDENNFSKSDSTFCNDKESYEKVLSKKLDNLKKCETGKFNKKKSFDNKINDLIKSSEQHEKNIQKNESAASIGESDTLFVDMQNIMDSSQDLFIEYSKDESDKDCKLSKKNYKIAEKNKENDEPLMKSNKLDNTLKACEKEKMHLESEVEHLKKEIKSLKKENKEKGKKMDSLKQKLNEQIKRTAEYEDLNKKLQKILIDKSEEKDLMEKKIRSTTTETEIDYNKNFFAVGYERESDNKVHVGRNIWVDSKIFNNVLNRSDKPITCVSNIMTALFDISILQKSTLTGRPSNRNGNKMVVQQLDPVTVGACKDWYSHWLTNCYKPKDAVNYSYDIEYANFRDYASKKISYLKRDLMPKKTLKRRSNNENKYKSKLMKYSTNKSKDIASDSEEDNSEQSKEEGENINEDVQQGSSDKNAKNFESDAEFSPIDNTLESEDDPLKSD